MSHRLSLGTRVSRIQNHPPMSVLCFVHLLHTRYLTTSLGHPSCPPSKPRSRGKLVGGPRLLRPVRPQTPPREVRTNVSGTRPWGPTRVPCHATHPGSRGPSRPPSCRGTRRPSVSGQGICSTTRAQKCPGARRHTPCLSVPTGAAVTLNSRKTKVDRPHTFVLLQN